MDLGSLIKILEALPPEKEIIFDFGYMQPTKLGSYRGDYSELALGYRAYGYTAPDQQNHFNSATVGRLLEECRSAIGKKYEGWKGGDYTMSEDSLVWVDNPGDYSSTVILGVGSHYDSVVLLTAKVET